MVLKWLNRRWFCAVFTVPMYKSKVFRALNIGAEEAQLKFGLLDALQYGAPPHGGLAFGLDHYRHHDDRRRSATSSPPKTQRAQCLLTQAPSKSTRSN